MWPTSHRLRCCFSVCPHPYCLALGKSFNLSGSQGQSPNSLPALNSRVPATLCQSYLCSSVPWVNHFLPFKVTFHTEPSSHQAVHLSEETMIGNHLSGSSAYRTQQRKVFDWFHVHLFALQSNSSQFGLHIVRTGVRDTVKSQGPG